MENLMTFENLVKKIKKYWPTLISAKTPSELGDIEDIASEQMIGWEDELLYRELSWSMKIYLHHDKGLPVSIAFDDIDFKKVKSIFERRIDEWTKDNDGFTSDMKARAKYYADNDTQETYWHWTPKPHGRPGQYIGPKVPKGPRAECRWVPPYDPNAEGKPTGPPGSKGYWKIKIPGEDGWQRFDKDGRPITPEEAHPGEKLRSILPKLRVGFPLIICPLCRFVVPEHLKEKSINES